MFFSQLASVVAEVFGQRASRIHHQGNTHRFLLSTVIFSSVQASITLLGTDLFLSDRVTHSQGFVRLVTHDLFHTPMVYFNALNNAVYWAAQAVLLKEPLGVVSIVIGFLVASFFVVPVQWALGMPTDSLPSAPVALLALVGGVLSVIEFKADHETPPGEVPPLELEIDQDQDLAGDLALDLDQELEGLVPPQPPQPPQPPLHLRAAPEVIRRDLPAISPTRLATHLLPAWMVLVATTSLGLVQTTYLEKKNGLNMFGYAAQDQVLLPLFTIPLAIAMDRPALGQWRAVAAQTWREFSLPTMIGYRGLSFAREFAFFFLATRFNLSSVYMEMTLLRIVLAWVAGVAVVVTIPSFVAVTQEEAERVTKDRRNQLMKAVSAVVITAVLALIRSKHEKGS